MPADPLLRRRTTLAGAAGSVVATVLAAGCDHGDDIGSPPPSTRPSTADQSSSAPPQTPDELLVDATVHQLTAAFGVLMTGRRFKQLRPLLTPVLKAHRRHVEVLEGDVEGWVAPALADPAAALQAVRRSEKQLQSALSDAAGQAENGALAKLLASMSASTTQFLTALPAEVGP